MNFDFKSLTHLERCFSNIFFIEKNHTYRFGNVASKTSVSGLIKKYEKPFDSNKVASFVAKRDGMTKEEVLNKWDFARDYSCHKGSEFHKFVENFLARKQTSLDYENIRVFYENRNTSNLISSVEDYYADLKKLIANFVDFYNWWKEDHILLKSEFVIGDFDSGVCGTIDNLSLNTKTNELVIFDYKTNKDIKRKNPRNEMMLDCLSHLQNCEYSKYSLQLSLYSYIIEKITSFSVPKSYIVWVNGETNYELIECLDLKKESSTILENYK